MASNFYRMLMLNSFRVTKDRNNTIYKCESSDFKMKQTNHLTNSLTNQEKLSGKF